jgi:DNA-binding NarL/FixJ family response regulator
MGMTVLIVDDHASFRSSARLLLESEGFEVLGEADDGRTAVEQTSALAPDLVLLDVQLPDLDGFEVARRIVANGGSARVILTSSREERDFGQLVKACGACGFVGKADLSGTALHALLK